MNLSESLQSALKCFNQGAHGASALCKHGKKLTSTSTVQRAIVHASRDLFSTCMVRAEESISATTTALHLKMQMAGLSVPWSLDSCFEVSPSFLFL